LSGVKTEKSDSAGPYGYRNDVSVTLEHDIKVGFRSALKTDDQESNRYQAQDA